VTVTGRQLGRSKRVAAASVAGSAGSRPSRHASGRDTPRLGGGPLGRRPLDVALGLAALLEWLPAPNDRAEGDSARLATGASLLAAAIRPHLRVGALVTATLGHSVRTLALTLEPESRRQKGRLALEVAMSAALGGLLHQAARAARWDR
jgi:hypothetical protein